MTLSLILLEHAEWLLGLAAAAFGAILMHRRHKAIQFVEVSKKTSQVLDDEIFLKSSDLLDEDFNPAENLRVFDEWEYESCMKGREWDRGGFLLRSEVSEAPLEAGQSTAAVEGARKSHSDEWDAGFDAFSEFGGKESWLRLARSVLKPGPAIASKGPLYLARAKNQVVKLWESSSRKLLTSWNLPDNFEFISALDVDERWGEVACGSSDGYLSLWDMASGGCVRTWQQLNTNVSAVKMNPHYRSLISGALEEVASTPVLQVWDTRVISSSVQSLVLPKPLSRFGMGPAMRIGTVEDQLYVTESGSVRQYDLRNLTKVIREEKVAESWALSDEQPEDEWWDAQQDECCEDDGDADDYDVGENKSAKSRHGMLTTLTSFLTSLIHS